MLYPQSWQSAIATRHNHAFNDFAVSVKQSCRSKSPPASLGYLPKVLVQRDRGGRDLEQPYMIAMIHATAPFYDEKKQMDYLEALRLKIFNVLRMGVQNNHNVFILGAWGCGDRGAPPCLVAKVFREVIDSAEMVGQFKHVVFAVLGDREYNDFKHEFSGA
eukprot:TRINITY_DN16486_c0_g1_i1.p2 TRINITY_DN16486_c0_g1~~TRINITY_DN16486_c0_g1_i1.p2  ORF type:complete len:161 (-),score=16.84 TRINITY_DN16486_c0_g1_i1:89-571(-)